MKKQLLIICTLLQGLISYAQEETLTTANGYYTAKCGVTSLRVNAWGGGGGGGRATTAGQTTGGGGGGAFAKTTITVSAGDMIPYQVGQGGSGGDSNNSIKDGGDTSFNAPTFFLSAEGGKGVPNNSVLGGIGGSAVGPGKWSGGSGGKGTGTGGKQASGGGGGSAKSTGLGADGGDGKEGGFWDYGGTGGKGGDGGDGGNGGDGAGSHGEGDAGKGYGGGGGGGKRAAIGGFGFPSQNGGKGANGVIKITYTLPTGTPQPIQAAASLDSNPGTSIGCNESQVTLTATGGNIGNGVSTLWYEGTTCPYFQYINEFMTDSPGTYSGTASTTLNNGNRLFTATNGDPWINMTNVLGSPVDVSSYKYITVRYRVEKSPNYPDPNSFEIYFKKGTLDLDEPRKVSNQIITDGLWHIINIDMSDNNAWKNDSDGDIKGWRFDYATILGTEIEIDYLVLGNIPILENINQTDAAITLIPTALSTTYGTIRISDQEGACNGGIPTTTCTQTTISRIDKTYNVASGNWSTATNWYPGNVLPNLNNCVNIQSGKDIVVDVVDAQAGRLNVENGGKIKISADKALYVDIGITNNDPSGNNFVVESNGNLIQLSNVVNTGNITVERNVKDMNNASNKMDYVYWSSPVFGQQTKGAGGFSPGTPNNYFFTYRESNDRFYETGDPTFVLGKGYAVRAETGINSETNQLFTNPYAKDYKFKGVPNNGEISIPITRSANTGATVHGYNLIGNPYPSNIDFDVLYEANKTIIYNQAWFWTNTSFTADQQGQGYSGNNYRVYNATGGQIPAVNGIIKVGQGFIVQSQGSEGSTSTFNFKNNHLGTPMRVANPGTFYQKNTSAKNRFWLKLISPNGVDNTQLIGYIDGATDGFEMGYDAEAFGMSSNLFYSILEDKQLLIQGKSAQFSADDHINLGANFFRNSSYTIELEQPEGIFANGQIIYLKDKLTGTITDLSQGSYTFEANKGVTNGRFEIIYKPETVLVTDNRVKDGVVVYRDSDHFVIKSPKTIMTVEVFDISGKLITVLKANNTQARLNAAFFTKGMYLLRIKTGDGEIINKKIIKQ